MRNYELVFVLEPDLKEQEKKDFFQKLKKAIEDFKGKVEEVKEWGRRILAYPIKKKEAGDYFLWNFSLPEESLPELEKKLRLENVLLRYMIVRKEIKRKEEKTSTKKKAK